MAAPTIKRIYQDGDWQWCVEFAGMMRCHRQDWQAVWLYNYFLQISQSNSPSKDAM
jgi:hypothetical protein